MYDEIKLSCAECLFSLACQRPLSKTDTLQLIGHLKDDSSLAADGTLSPVTLNLLMALLYCFDVSIVEREDSDGEHGFKSFQTYRIFHNAIYNKVRMVHGILWGVTGYNFQKILYFLC